MLRITIHTHPTCLTLQLEGKLAGPWVRELAACWQRILADQGRPVDRVDLAALTSLDTAGKELLAAMHAQGAELVAADCLMKAIVAEIIGAPIPGSIGTVEGSPSDVCAPDYSRIIRLPDRDAFRMAPR
jgi:ABC-type transporter Mla MlaB component